MHLSINCENNRRWNCERLILAPKQFEALFYITALHCNIEHLKCAIASKRIRTLLLAFAYFKPNNITKLQYYNVHTLVQHVWLYFISLFSWDSTQLLITTNFEGICKLVKPDRAFFALLSSDEINWKSYFCTGDYTFLKSSLVHMIGTPWGWAKSFCLNKWFFW